VVSRYLLRCKRKALSALESLLEVVDHVVMSVSGPGHIGRAGEREFCIAGAAMLKQLKKLVSRLHESLEEI